MHDLLNLEQQTYQIPNFVHDLWLPDIKQWDATKISTLFGQQDATVILQVPIITAQGQDMLCWTPTSSGTCTSKSAYKQLAVQQRGATIPTHIPHQVLELLRKVWDDKLVQPRLKTFAWRLLRLALVTASRVNRIIPAVSAICSRCSSTETEAHLFFECSFAKAVWLQSPLRLRSDALPQTNRGIHHQLRYILQQQPTVATTSLVLSILWCLWKERDDHHFNDKHWTPTRVISEAQAIDSAGTLLLQDNTALATSRTTHNNVPSPYATLLPAQSLYAGEQSVNAGIRCYTDASIPSENQIVGPTYAGWDRDLHPPYPVTATVQQL
jgi:hypothetical protein